MSARIKDGKTPRAGRGAMVALLLYLPQDLSDDLDRMAQDLAEPKSGIARAAVRSAVARWKKQSAA